ncbi:putative alpha-glucosidase [Basidiobolus meristosporus CBS 931.73]|uniref:Maltase n=1 Tax=Basidiobolus meristosporus CBS 931.73 TaxID=1314790 RepID=A0A1Y1X0W1_9FUNG|nr:putative alpha-glucosidase [Basidiobolus meristosporus CBS 931.73]|eukprot:ORX78974.1 putative alpha-glucosidase [Basidiobolus meristosporus CBS 931.73]
MVKRINILCVCLGFSALANAQYRNSTQVGSADCPGYSVTSVQTRGNSLFSRLSLRGQPCNQYGKDVKDLLLEVDYENSRLRVKISDADQKHWEVPVSMWSPDKSYRPKTSMGQLLEFAYQKDPFSFQVKRKDTGEVLFDTSKHRLVFEDTYLELTSSLPENANIYGLGEVVDTFRRDPTNTTQAMWGRDVADPVRENLYGTHPFYIELRNGKAHGVQILNSYGMDVILEKNSVAYKAIGGVLDFSFYPGSDAYEVINQYTATVGRPHQIPYWSLGFHQCRYGYVDIDEVEGVVKNYSLAKIPLETMWTDIEYMDMFKDFTLDPINYPLERVQKFVSELHDNGQQYVLIIDPAIQRNESYATWTEGVKQDVFIKNPDGSIYIGQVWPGYTAFPDWFAPNTQQWWTSQIKNFMDDVAIDGLWIDMNEPASFCVGSCGSNRTGIPPYPWEDPNYKPDIPQTFPEPPYAIHNAYGNLSVKTVSTEAVHHGGLTEYQVHNLYGHMEAIATRKSLLSVNPNKRPFLLGRSTFAGSGAHEGHWTGDNWSTWEQLRYSISGVLSFQMFGIPYVGADICGFNGNTTEELCLRWMQLGSLYPFSRNHNGKGNIAQEAYVWPSVAEASRKALHTRYEILPYLYTQFQHAHETGHPVWRPLAFEFPNDQEMLNNDLQFLVGPGILASPVLAEGATTVDAKFPEGIWYDYYNWSPINGTAKRTLSAPLDGNLPLHIRGGHIIPTQEPAITIAQSRENPFSLLVALDEQGNAEGGLYLDDGQSIHVGQQFSKIFYRATSRGVQARGHFGYRSKALLKNITILGLKAQPNEVRVDGRAISPNQIFYHAEKRTLIIAQLSASMNRPLRVTF